MIEREEASVKPDVQDPCPAKIVYGQAGGRRAAKGDPSGELLDALVAVDACTGGATAPEFPVDALADGRQGREAHNLQRPDKHASLARGEISTISRGV